MRKSAINPQNRILFAGTPDFAVPVLRALHQDGHPLVAVYTQPDRPSGRGRKLTPSPVKDYALHHGLPVFQPHSLKRDAAAVQQLRAHGADLMVVVAYGLILPQAVLTAPRLGCVNVHASLLPRWRGAAPIQRALLAGDSETGITIMQMDEGLDTGAMLHRLVCPIGDEDTGGSLHDRLADLGARALMESLPGILAGSQQAEPQDTRQACYADKLSKGEGEIDWRGSADEIGRRVRAFNPWPVCQTDWRGHKLRIWLARPLAGASAGNQPPGSVVAVGKEGIDVACGRGVLRVTRLQMPGKKPLSADQFINAFDLSGQRLGEGG